MWLWQMTHVFWIFKNGGNQRRRCCLSALWKLTEEKQFPDFSEFDESSFPVEKENLQILRAMLSERMIFHFAYFFWSFYWLKLAGFLTKKVKDIFPSNFESSLLRLVLWWCAGQLKSRQLSPSNMRFPPPPKLRACVYVLWCAYIANLHSFQSDLGRWPFYCT